MRCARLILAMALLGTLALVGAARAIAEPTAREQVGRPVLAAQSLLKQKRPQEALAKLHDADAVKDKTSYEIYIIEETRAAAQIEATDYDGAIKSLDAVVATGLLAPAERLKRVQTQVQLAYQLQRYPATIERASRYYQQGGSDPLPRRLEAQAYYLDGDFANASRTIRAALEADQPGATPPEDLLQTLASSEFKRPDPAGYRDALTRLVTFYPKPASWADLLNAVGRAPGFSARLALDLDRLRLARGAIDAPDAYLEAAERALSAGLPGDAKRFLDHGYAAGILGKGAQAERHQRLADMAARQAADNARALPQLATEVETARTGVAWAKLGEAYASYGQYGAATAALERGLARGSLPFPDDARLHLGVAYLDAGQATKAKAVLSAIAGRDGTAELARLWLLPGGRD
jgi:hypothetical protein